MAVYRDEYIGIKTKTESSYTEKEVERPRVRNNNIGPFVEKDLVEVKVFKGGKEITDANFTYTVEAPVSQGKELKMVYVIDMVEMNASE